MDKYIPYSSIRHARSTIENTSMDDPDFTEIQQPVLEMNEKETSSYLFNSSLYTVLKLDKQTNSVVMKCTTCFKCIKGNIHSTGNFISHIKVSTCILYFNNCIYKN